MAHPTTHCVSALGLVTLLGVPAVCRASGGPPDSESPALRLERPDDPYMPPVESPNAGSSANVTFGGFISVQVNVNGLGNNVIGDAANEPSIAVDPTAANRVAIGWRQFDTILSNFRQAGHSFSRDGGRSWAGKSIIEPGIFRSDPVLAAGEDGTFYFLSLSIVGPQQDFLNDMFISSDGGATWPTKHFAFGGDKSWFTIDRTGGIGAGNLYQGWNTAGNEFFPNQFNRSTDGGVTWENPVEYDPGPQPARPVFGILDVGPDGSVYVAGSANSFETSTFWVVKSSNAQDSGQTPVFDQITTVNMGGNLLLATGPNPAGLLGQVNISVDRSGGPHHGNVYVLCSIDPPGLDPMDIHFVRSTDGGQTFSAPIRVNNDPGPPFGSHAWQWFGTMSVAPNGRIDVVWNDARNTAGAVNLFQTFYAFSDDGGLSFQGNFPMTPVFDSFVGWPQQNKLGDYYDMISDRVGADLAYAATFNGEQDVYYLRIGDYDCNGNGVADPDDIAGLTSGDCNSNDIPDECEIAAGTLADDDGNGIPDVCEVCPWDCQAAPQSGAVDVPDLLALLAAWGGPQAPGTTCDFDGGGIAVPDLLKLLANWGPCP